MNRLGLTDYNSAIKSIYDSNTITPDGEEEKIPSGTKESKSGESTLVKETLRLRNTAVLNLKLKQKIFKYEKKRLNQLKVEDVLGSDKVTTGSGDARGTTSVVPDAEGKGGGFKLPRLFFGNRLKGKGKGKFKSKGKFKGKGKGKVTVGKGGVKPNRFKRLNPFKPKVTSKVPGGLNNPLKGLGNPFKKRPPITRGKGGIPPGLNKVFPNFGSKVTTGKGSQPGIVKNLNKLNPFKGKGPTITGVKPGALSGLKSLRNVPLLSAVFAGFEFAGRKGEGQTNVQAGLGTAGSTAGGLAGLKGGAALGATIGSAIFPGAGTVVGGLLGGLVGGFAGSSIGGGLTDMLTGANKKKDAKSINTYEKEEKPNQKLSVKRDVSGRFDLETGKAYINGQEVSAEEYTKFINLSPQEKIQQYGQLEGLKDGGVTGNTPQVVIVGDGGEKEYIVPESKLSYFLGTSQAAKYLNYGISPLITAAKKYASSEGIDTSSIKELKDVSDVPSENVKPITGLEVNLGKTFFDNVKKGLMKLLNPFSSAITIIKKLNPFNWFKKSKKDKPKYTMGYAPGQIEPDQFVTGYKNLTIETSQKMVNGKLVDFNVDKKFERGDAAVAVEDLIEHQKDFMSRVNEVPGYEDVSFDDYMEQGLPNMPIEVYTSILKNSDAGKATKEKSMAAYKKFLTDNNLVKPDGSVKGYSYFNEDFFDEKSLKPTINKDSVVEQDPMEDIQIDLPQIILPQPQVVTQYLPLTVPMYQKGKDTVSSNTPAWGNNSLIGG
tara:strand:+ start:1039 stop:3345 length:2307 start_codon:yes stop_codon:yes gene_type:complete